MYGRFEVSAPPENVVVIVDRQPDFDNIGIFEQRFYKVENSGSVESEQIAMLAGRKLEQCNFIGLAFFERRASFGVETDVGVLVEIAQCSTSFFGSVDDCNRFDTTGILNGRQLGELLLGDSYVRLTMFHDGKVSKKPPNNPSMSGEKRDATNGWLAKKYYFCKQISIII